MSMTIILAPNQREGIAYAREHGYTRRNSCIVTPHGNSDDGRGVVGADFRIVGEPKFPEDKLFSIGFCFMHNDEALAAWQAGLDKLRALSTSE